MIHLTLLSVLSKLIEKYKLLENEVEVSNLLDYSLQSVRLIQTNKPDQNDATSSRNLPS